MIILAAHVMHVQKQIRHKQSNDIPLCTIVPGRRWQRWTGNFERNLAELGTLGNWTQSGEALQKRTKVYRCCQARESKKYHLFEIVLNSTDLLLLVLVDIHFAYLTIRV